MKMVASLVILIATAVVYGNSLDNQFTNWDDDALVVNNQAIRSLDGDNLKKIFRFRFGGGTYQPLRTFSYALDYHFFGLNPTGYHVHNIILHAMAGIFLFLGLCFALPKIYMGPPGGKAGSHSHPGLSESHACWIAFFSALLFAVHPVNVEAVTWLSSRKYVLLSFFSFLSFFLFVISLENAPRKNLWRSLSILSVVGACLSSPFGVVLPALFFLFVCSIESECSPAFLMKKYLFDFMPYGLVGTLLLFLLMKNLVGASGASMAHFNHDWHFTFFSMMNCLVDYMRNLLCPLWLNNRYMDYVYPSFFIYYKVPLGLLGLCSALFFALYGFFKGRKIYFFGITWFLTAWLPASNIIPISTKMADRYIYLAAPGLFLLFVYLIFNVAVWIDRRGGGSSGKYFNLAFAGTLLSLVLIYSGLAMERNAVWANSGTLWRDSLKKDANNNLAQVNLAVYLFEQGKVQEAIEHLAIARKLKPDDLNAVKNLAMIMKAGGSDDKAIFYYSKANKIKPGDGDVLLNLASLYQARGSDAVALDYASRIKYEKTGDVFFVHDLAELYTRGGQPAKAVAILKDGLQKYPENPHLYYAMGRAQSGLGNLKEGVHYFKEVIRLDPEFSDAYNNLGLMHEKLGDYHQACSLYRKALEYNPGDAEACNNMGNVLLKFGSVDRAVSFYKKAISLDEKFVKAHYNLACAYKQAGLWTESIKQYKYVLTLDNEHINALNNLANVMLKMNSSDRAIQLYEKAVELDPGYVNAYFNLSTALCVKKAYHRALKYVNTALGYSPRDIGLLRLAGMISVKVGDNEGGLKFFNRIIDLGQGTGEIYYYLGIVNLNMERFGQAKERMKKALSLAGEDSPLHHKIRLTAKKAGLAL